MAAKAGSTSPQQLCSERRQAAFRKLLSRISQHLGEDDVKKCAFIQSIPKDRRTSALGILEYLMQSGAFSHANTEPLIQLLKDIDRHELVSDLVEPYMKEYSEDISPADAATLGFPSKERPKTNPAATNLSSAVQEMGPVLTDTSLCDAGLTFKEPLQQSSEKIAQTPSALSTTSSESKLLNDDLLQPSHCLSQKEMSQPDGPASASTYHLPFHTMGGSSPSRSTFSPSSSFATLQLQPSLRAMSASYQKRPKPLLSNRISAPVLMNYGSQSPDISPLCGCVQPDGGQFHHSQVFYTPSSAEGSPRGKKLGNVFGLKKGSSKRVRGRTTQRTWSIERERLRQPIWDHKYLDFQKCTEPVPIDIECGPLNPYLSLHLYPYGLFEDQNKSITLLIKVIIPDECPPIPSDAPFSLSWEIVKVDTAGTMKIDCSKKPIKVQFQTGLIYLHKFLPHTVLQQHVCKMFEIIFFVHTTYSIHDNYSNNTASDEMLLSLKTLYGKLNIAREIGEAYKQFGRSLLEDKDETVTTSIAERLDHNAAAINQEILGLWLQGKGRQPVQWSTVIDTLREINLLDLASQMEQNLKIS